MATSCIYFFSKKNDFRSLSNFWKCDIIIEDREYDSGEHCFHGEKFYRLSLICENELRKQILFNYSKQFLKPNDQEPSLIKRLGRSLILTQQELENWNKLSIIVQIEICNYKFMNYEEVRNDLEKSENSILMHPATRVNDDKMNTRIWEGRWVDGKVIGRNMLGKIWMDLRSKLI